MTALVLAGGAESQPVVLAFEDLHWADPTSLDLLRALAERGAQAPLLVVATTRPEFRAPWGMRSHHAVDCACAASTGLRFDAWSARSPRSHALSARRLSKGSASAPGGVPLFVEEVTRLLVERGEQRNWRSSHPADVAAVSSQRASIGSGPAREVAQVGAVLERDFRLCAAARRRRRPTSRRFKHHWIGSPTPTCCFVEGAAA